MVFDWRDLVAGEKLGEQPHHHPPILQHVRDTGRDAQIVLEHIEFTGSRADDVDAGDVGVDVIGDAHSLHFRPVLRVAQDLFLRDDAGTEDVLRMVDIADEGVQGLDALTQSARKKLPLAGRDDARNDVERNQALGTAFFAINSEGDPDPVKQRIGFRPLCIDLARGHRVQPAVVTVIVRSNTAAGVLHFVVELHRLHGSSSLREYMWCDISEKHARQ